MKELFICAILDALKEPVTPEMMEVYLKSFEKFSKGHLVEIYKHQSLSDGDLLNELIHSAVDRNSAGITFNDVMKVIGNIKLDKMAERLDLNDNNNTISTPVGIHYMSYDCEATMITMEQNGILKSHNIDGSNSKLYYFTMLGEKGA